MEKVNENGYMTGTPRPFGLSDKLGYMFGDIANNMTFNLASTFLIVFYTEVLYIEGAIVGSLFVVARVVDAFTDIGMGKIVDKAPPTKDGKFKPWIKRIAGPVCLASFLMYQPALVHTPMIVRIIFMYVTYLLWGSVFYTAVNIPYGSMAAAVSSDPDHRTSLSVFRGAGGAIGGLLIGTVTPLFIYAQDGAGNPIVSGRNFMLVAGAFAIAGLVFYYLCFKMTTERVKIKQSKEAVSFFRSIALVITNRSLVSIMAASILLLMTMLVIPQMANYVIPYYYGNPDGVALNNLLTIGTSIIILPIASILAQKIGKKEIGSIGMLLGSLFYFILFFWKPDSLAIFITFSTLAYGSLGLFNATVWASITDVIDDHQVRTNQREDGTIYGVNSFARKLGQAAAGGIGGIALTAIGYVSGAATQAPEVLDRLYDVTVLLPAIGFLVAGLILIFWYPLNKKQVKKNQQILETTVD